MDPVSGIGKDGTSVPSFIDCPSTGAFREIVRIHQFQVLAGKAKLASHETRKTLEYTSTGFGCCLHRVCRTFLHNWQVGAVKFDLERGPRFGAHSILLRLRAILATTQDGSNGKN
jgi:hypothetical protein